MWVKRGCFVEMCLKDNSIIYGRVDDIIIDQKLDGRWDTDILLSKMNENNTNNGGFVVISMSFVEYMKLKNIT